MGSAGGTREAGVGVVAPFRFDRTWDFPVEPEDLWAVFEQTDRYQSWWPWLRRLDVSGPLLPRGIADCVIRAPLGYSLAFSVRVTDVDAPHVLEAFVVGDIRGPARLEVGPTAFGSYARVSWEVELRDQILRPVARVARPALEWGHEYVVASGLQQFRRRALTGA